MTRLPKEAIALVEWLSNEIADAFADVGVRRAPVSFSRSDQRRLRTLLVWLRNGGYVASDTFSQLPTAPARIRKSRGRFARGRCPRCNRNVAVKADGTTRPHRGGDACRYGYQLMATSLESQP